MSGADPMGRSAAAGDPGTGAAGAGAGGMSAGASGPAGAGAAGTGGGAAGPGGVRGGGAMNGTRGLVIAIVAAFIVGGSMGMVGGILFARSVMQPPPRPAAGVHGPRMGGARGTRPMLGMLERSLDLSPGQRQRIEAILEGSRHGYAQVRESTHAAIERELTPAQREEWKQLEERYLRERRRGSGRPPWRGDRP